MSNQLMRADLKIIQKWIEPNQQVLDLGCGDGSLLHFLKQHKGIAGYGLEIDPVNIQSCLEKGINVIEKDLDTGLEQFASKSFDVVVMSQALQMLHHPHQVLLEMLRIGRQCIITFPNFGHWRCRMHLAVKGRMPVSELMPYSWYDTPNIHFCTFSDFDSLCAKQNIKILNRLATDQAHQQKKFSQRYPNLFGEIGIYHLQK